MHPCEPFLFVVYPTHILMHPRVRRAHRLKSAALKQGPPNYGHFMRRAKTF